MTIDELIERLEEYRDDMGGDTEVRLMTQQNWPFENGIVGLASGEEINEAIDEDEPDDDADVTTDQVVYICEGQQLCYGTKRALAGRPLSRNARSGVAAGGSRRLMMAANHRPELRGDQPMNATKSTQATKSVKSKPAAKTKKAETTNGDGKNLSAHQRPCEGANRIHGADELQGTDRRDGGEEVLDEPRWQDASADSLQGGDNVAEISVTCDRLIPRGRLRPQYGSGWQPG